MGVTDVREEKSELEDEGELVEESRKYTEYCQEVVAAPDKDISDEARLVLWLPFTRILLLVEMLLSVE